MNQFPKYKWLLPLCSVPRGLDVAAGTIRDSSFPDFGELHRLLSSQTGREGNSPPHAYPPSLASALRLFLDIKGLLFHIWDLHGPLLKSFLTRVKTWDLSLEFPSSAEEIMHTSWALLTPVPLSFRLITSS